MCHVVASLSVYTQYQCDITDIIHGYGCLIVYQWHTCSWYTGVRWEIIMVEWLTLLDGWLKGKELLGMHVIMATVYVFKYLYSDK